MVLDIWYAARSLPVDVRVFVCEQQTKRKTGHEKQ